MVFTETHWEALTRQGYTIVSGAIDARRLARPRTLQTI